MPEWDGEIEVDETLVRALIRDSYPALRASPFQTLATGCDKPERLTAGQGSDSAEMPLVKRAISTVPSRSARATSEASASPRPVPPVSTGAANWRAAGCTTARV
ncbi:MAG: hypothetical protein ACXVSC_21980 [Solirubrobacteraceae bacterium]